MRPISRLLHLFAFLALLAGILATPAHAQDVALIVENDPAYGNSRPDDLYTSSLTLHAELSRGTLRFGERMFTDRERALRFDESWITYTAPAVQIGEWQTEAGAGVIRVGRGFIGDRAQNVLHEWIGSELLDLPYVERSTTFATAELRGQRPLGSLADADWTVHAEAFGSPDFRSWVRGGIAADRHLERGIVLRAGAGFRADRAEERYFGDTISRTGVTGEVAVVWRSIALRWTFNEHGTGTPNVSIGYSTSPAALLRR